jgi:tetratricopeptide (TPR) repeat protein
MTVSRFLRRRQIRTDRYGRELPVLAAIDQAEELFRLNSDYGQALLEELIEAVGANRRLRFLLVLREEYIGDLTAYDKIFDSADVGRLHVDPLTREAALAAIRGPVDNSGRSYGPGAAEALADVLLPAAGELSSTIEPALLQVACGRLWESLPEGELVITGDQVQFLGIVDRSLAGYIGRVLAETSQEYELAAEQLLVLVQVTFGHGRMATEEPGQTEGMPNSVLYRLQDRYLLRVERESGVRRFRLQDDRLAGPLEQTSVAGMTQPSPEASMLAATRAWDEGDLARAERHARRVIAAEQETNIRLRAEAESILGSIAFTEGVRQVAAEHYRNAAVLFELVRETDMVSLLLAALGRAEIEEHRNDAIGAFQSAVARNPEDLGIQIAFAQGLKEMNYVNAAISVLDHVLVTSGDEPEALRVRSEIMDALGNVDSAVRDRDRMHRGQTPRARAAWALILAAAHQLSAAEKEIGSALDEAPDNGPVLFYAAQIEVLRGNTEAAAELTGRAIAATQPPLSPGLRERAQTTLPPEAGRAGAGKG